jgi:predicted nucleotidyltransferase
MAKGKVIAAVKFFEERLREKKVEVTKIILFGSWAGGNASPESDVDIVVISKDFRNKDIFRRLALIKDAEIATIKKYMIPLDVIMMTPDEFTSGTSLVSEFAKKGKVISAA